MCSSLVETLEKMSWISKESNYYGDLELSRYYMELTELEQKYT